MGLLAGLSDAGVQVPDDVSIVGYDNTALAHMRHVGLTTIDEPRHEMGELAVTTLLERIRDERTRSVIHKTTPTLVARRTSAPPGSSQGRLAHHSGGRRHRVSRQSRPHTIVDVRVIPPVAAEATMSRGRVRDGIEAS